MLNTIVGTNYKNNGTDFLEQGLKHLECNEYT